MGGGRNGGPLVEWEVDRWEALGEVPGGVLGPEA